MKSLSWSWFIAELRIPVWRRRFLRLTKFCAWCVLWLGSLVILAVVVENWRGSRVWKNHVAEATAAGEFFDIAPLIPPPVPDNENFATAPIFQPFFDYTLENTEGPHEGWPNDIAPKWRNGYPPQPFNDITDRVWPRIKPNWNNRFTFPNWRKGEMVDLSKWQDFLHKARNIDTPMQFSSSGEEVLHEFAKYDRELEGLREANRRPRARFPLRYEDGPSIIVLHYGFLQGAAQLLRMRVFAELSLNQIEVAQQDQLLAFRLAESLEGEPLLISALVRISILEISMPQLWEGMARGAWKEEQLALFEQRLASINLVEHFRRTIQWERSGGLTAALDLLERQRNIRLAEGFIRSGTESSRWYDDTPLWLRKSVLWAAPAGWFEQNKVVASRVLTQPLLQCIDTHARRFFPDKVRAAKNAFEELRRSRTPYTLLTRGTDYSYLPVKFAFAQGTVNLARIAIALERHRIRHGGYPATLAALDAAVAPSGQGIPNDPASGSPPHYRPIDAGVFELYYDGWNGTDDGGRFQWQHYSSRPQEDQGDWLWPVVQEKPQPEL